MKEVPLRSACMHSSSSRRVTGRGGRGCMRLGFTAWCMLGDHSHPDPNKKYSVLHLYLVPTPAMLLRCSYEHRLLPRPPHFRSWTLRNSVLQSTPPSRIQPQYLPQVENQRLRPYLTQQTSKALKTIMRPSSEEGEGKGGGEGDRR